MLWIISRSSSGPIWTMSSDRICPKHSSSSMVSWTDTALMAYALGSARISSPRPSYSRCRRLNISRTSSGFWTKDSWAQWIMVWEISSWRVPGWNEGRACYKLNLTLTLKLKRKCRSGPSTVLILLGFASSSTSGFSSSSFFLRRLLTLSTRLTSLPLSEVSTSSSSGSSSICIPMVKMWQQH